MATRHIRIADLHVAVVGAAYGDKRFALEPPTAHSAAQRRVQKMHGDRWVRSVLRLDHLPAFWLATGGENRRRPVLTAGSVKQLPCQDITAAVMSFPTGISIERLTIARRISSHRMPSSKAPAAIVLRTFSDFD